jgi:hypothetical protein
MLPFLFVAQATRVFSASPPTTVACVEALVKLVFVQEVQPVVLASLVRQMVVFLPTMDVLSLARMRLFPFA